MTRSHIPKSGHNRVNCKFELDLFYFIAILNHTEGFISIFFFPFLFFSSLLKNLNVRKILRSIFFFNFHVGLYEPFNFFPSVKHFFPILNGAIQIKRLVLLFI